MRIARVRIDNFRSIRSLELELGDTTVFIGGNNVGKSAIMEAVRIALTRRWGLRGTGFTENDVHRPDETGDPRTLPPVSVEITLEERAAGQWDVDMVAELDEIVQVRSDGRNSLTLRVNCAWNEEREAFDPVWEFLDLAGQPLTGQRRRSMNFTNFFQYLPLFWLDALRDASDEFKPGSSHWGRLLRAIRIPDALQSEAMATLTDLDARIIAADPRLAELAETIGQATHVAIGDSPGNARLNALPMSIEDILQRAGISVRGENLRPWLPLDHHGQGLQSLAVIFLFQASVELQLRESTRSGVEAVFAIEEPEVHLHPQAARTLWQRIQGLPGQTLLTTHSPYFVQHVPLHDIRLVRLRDGCTEIAAIRRSVTSSLQWTPAVDQVVRDSHAAVLQRDAQTDTIKATGPFSAEIADRLTRCYRRDADFAAKVAMVRDLRRHGRLLISPDEEQTLAFHGRRIRGEIFFARRWILVEGVCEYLLLHAMGTALGWPLDPHGVSVIDFQQSGSPGIYVSLAEALGIPWNMVVDGDPQNGQFRDQILSRGFEDVDLGARFARLTVPNNLEEELLSGHENLLRQVMAEVVGPQALTAPLNDLQGLLKGNKTAYMSRLAPRIAADAAIAQTMPAPFVQLVVGLRDGTL